MLFVFSVAIACFGSNIARDSANSQRASSADGATLTSTADAAIRSLPADDLKLGLSAPDCKPDGVPTAPPGEQQRRDSDETDETESSYGCDGAVTRADEEENERARRAAVSVSRRAFRADEYATLASVAGFAHAQEAFRQEHERIREQPPPLG